MQSQREMIGTSESPMSSKVAFTKRTYLVSEPRVSAVTPESTNLVAAVLSPLMLVLFEELSLHGPH